MSLPKKGAAGNGGIKIKEAHAYGKTEENILPATQGAAEGGMLMFTAKERSLLTSPYFRLIRQTDDFYEIQSRCTKHCWIIQKHGHASTVSSAVRQIKSHDVWQLNGRRAMA